MSSDEWGIDQAMEMTPRYEILSTTEARIICTLADEVRKLRDNVTQLKDELHYQATIGDFDEDLVSPPREKRKVKLVAVSRRKATPRKLDDCPDCGGSGLAPGDGLSLLSCSTCDGSGAQW